MSDEPSPELRELAAKLFAAGRAERPSPALGRRLLLIGSPRSRRAERPPLEQCASVQRQGIAVRASRVAFWIAAAALLGAGVWQVLAPAERVLSISRERAPSRFDPRSFGPPLETWEPLAGIDATRGGKTVSTPGPGERAGHAKPSRVASLPVVSPENAEVTMAPSELAASRPAASGQDSPDTASPSGTVARGVGAGGAAVRPATRQHPRPAHARAAVIADPHAAPAASPSSDRGTLHERPVEAKPMSLLDELELLKRARDVLRSGDPAGALDLLDRHGREHVGRGLDAEATLLRIETYAALGRHGEASELAARFVRENPNSALGDRAKSFIRLAPRTVP
jgi:hypothetical protein